MTKHRHRKKFLNFILKQIDNIQSPQILEFGVSDAAMSTGIFLELCNKNGGKLISIDMNNYSKKFQDPNWKFIHTRDDNYELIEKFIKTELDIIYLDTLHKADHVEKMLYHYYNNLKVNGYFFIDDTSWLPYTINNDKNDFFKEINNQETYEKLLNIYNSNQENFDLEFSFVGTGIAKIKKLNNEKLNTYSKIKSRKFSLKNLFRKIFKLLRISNKK
jgi:hypothetical protein